MITKITPKITSFEFKNFGSIVYLIQLKNQNILIDTSSKENKEELLSALSSLNLKTENITTIILTHGHYDHIENINLFTKAKIYSDAKEAIMYNNNIIDFSKVLPINEQPIKEFEIYKTPGHTNGDIVILYKNILFSGDVIFHNGYIGRTDLPESDQEQMQKSLDFIKNLKFDILCPGH